MLLATILAKITWDTKGEFMHVTLHLTISTSSKKIQVVLLSCKLS